MPLLDLSPGQVERLMSGLSYRKAFKKRLGKSAVRKKKKLVCRLGCIMLELFYAQRLTGFALRPQGSETLDLSSGLMQLMRWSNIKIDITYCT